MAIVAQCRCAPVERRGRRPGRPRAADEEDETANNRDDVLLGVGRDGRDVRAGGLVVARRDDAAAQRVLWRPAAAGKRAQIDADAGRARSVWFA